MARPPAPSASDELFPTDQDDLGAIPLEGSGFEDQRPDNTEDGEA